MLIDTDCKNASCPPDRKRARLTDAGGLYLEISPGGGFVAQSPLYAISDEGRSFSYSPNLATIEL